MTYKKPNKDKKAKKDQPKLEKVTYAFIGTQKVVGKGGEKVTNDDFYKIRADNSYNRYQSKWTPSEAFEIKKAGKLKSFFGRSILWILLVVAFIIVIFHHIIFNETLELFSKGYEIGIVLSRLSLAYIASFVFYLIVVLRKEKKNKKNIYAVVYGLTKTLIGNSNSALHEILKANNKQIKIFDSSIINRSEFKKLCANCNPYKLNEQGKLLGMEIENHGVQMVNNYIEKIFIYMPFLIGEYVMLISKIQNTRFFKHAGLLIFGLEENIEKLSDIIYDYFLVIEALDKYNQKTILNEIN